MVNKQLYRDFKVYLWCTVAIGLRPWKMLTLIVSTTLVFFVIAVVWVVAFLNTEGSINASLIMNVISKRLFVIVNTLNHAS